MARILVVEDDLSMQRFLMAALMRSGHTMIVAGNGAEALKVLAVETFDLVLTDIVMPDVEGMELLREIRLNPSAPPIIAMSGGGQGAAGDYLEMATMLGAAATLIKPFSPQELETALSRVLAPQLPP